MCAATSEQKKVCTLTEARRVQLENDLFVQLRETGAEIGRLVRHKPFFQQPGEIRTLLLGFQPASRELSDVRTRLYGYPRANGAERVALILDENVLFADIFARGMKLNRALRKVTYDAAIIQALDRQNALGLRINDIHFGTFVAH